MHVLNIVLCFCVETKNKQQQKILGKKKSNEEKQIKIVLILIVLAVRLGDFIQSPRVIQTVR